MKYRGFEIDINALAALVTALGGLLMVIKGAQQRNKNKEDK